MGEGVSVLIQAVTGDLDTPQHITVHQGRYSQKIHE